jgi:hypothetical protein
LKASANGKITGPLVVDEKGLVKLDELLRQRLSQIAPTILVRYVVTYPNNVYYETDSLRTVVSDDNSSVRPIVSLSLSGGVVASDSTTESGSGSSMGSRSSSDHPKIAIELGNEEASYSIAGANRDWVLATEVDIGERLKPFSVPAILSVLRSVVIFLSFIAGFIGLFLSGALVFRWRYNRARRIAQPAFAGVTLVDYIFRTHDASFAGVFGGGLLVSSIFASVGCAALSQHLLTYLIPGVVFLFGDQITAYSTIESVRAYILTGALGVLSTFVLGVATSLVVNLMTRSR